MKTISFINHKGGTGKTTSTINVGAALTLVGKKVLLIDFDPQANLTQSCGIVNPQLCIYSSLSKNLPLPIINIKDDLDLVPASLDLAGIEIELSARMARETYLKKLFYGMQTKYDCVLIDCPPSLGLLTINALVASNKVLIPMEAEYLAFRGVNGIINISNSVKEHFNPSLDISGVFLTKYNSQRKLTHEIELGIHKYFGDVLLKSKIRVNVSLAESQASGVDIFQYDLTSNGAKDYQNLVSELIIKKII
jgi:chromosome partitioning protein